MNKPLHLHFYADVERVVDFLVREKSFNEDRVRKAMKRVVDNRGKSGQSRMESFFQVSGMGMIYEIYSSNVAQDL
jgi:hypothetical protein